VSAAQNEPQCKQAAAILERASHGWSRAKLLS
jgi:hypothetical protein